MIHCEILKRKRYATAIALALLLPKECMLVRPIVRQFPYIRTLGYIRPVMHGWQ